MLVSVDLPIPGAPPISTTDPGTIPPPSTRSSSPIPLASRGISGALTSPSATGTGTLAPLRAGAARPRGSSTSVFHSAHPGQRPCQRGSSCPQLAQT